MPKPFLAFLALALVSPVAPAQIVNLGAGALVTESGEAPVVELFAATAPLRGLRAYSTLALNLEDTGLDLIAAVDGEVAELGAVRVHLGLGANFLEVRDYDPEPIVVATLVVPIRSRWNIAMIASAEPGNDWGWSLVVKLNRNLFFGR